MRGGRPRPPPFTLMVNLGFAAWKHSGQNQDLGQNQGQNQDQDQDQDQKRRARAPAPHNCYCRSKSRTSASFVALTVNCGSSLMAAPSPWFRLLPFSST